MATYIGNTPTPQSTQYRDRYVAVEGQTTFWVSGYTPGYVDVYLNGIKLDVADYTAADGASIVLATGATANDNVEIIGYSTFEVAADIVDKLRVTASATAAQTSFTSIGVETYDVEVFLNGVLLDTADYNITTNTVTLATAAQAGDEFVLIGYKPFQISNVDAGAKQGTFWENNTTITNSYTITSGKNAGTFGPVTIADGVTVTVPDGSTWTII